MLVRTFQDLYAQPFLGLPIEEEKPDILVVEAPVEVVAAPVVPPTKGGKKPTLTSPQKEGELHSLTSSHTHTHTHLHTHTHHSSCC